MLSRSAERAAVYQFTEWRGFLSNKRSWIPIYMELDELLGRWADSDTVGLRRYADTWAALRVGLRTALRAALWPTLQIELHSDARRTNSEYNEDDVTHYARLYSEMNSERVDCCFCLLSSCTHVKQVQKRRSQIECLISKYANGQSGN